MSARNWLKEIGCLESGQVFKVIGIVGFPPFLHLFQKGLLGAGLHIVLALGTPDVIVHVTVVFVRVDIHPCLNLNLC